MKKRTWIISIVGLGLLSLPYPLCFSAQNFTDHTLFGQDTTWIVLAEQSSERDSQEEGYYYSTTAGVLGVVGISCILFANALFFVRIFIISSYGYPTGLRGYFDPLYDHIVIREIAKTKASEEQRLLYTWINILIPVLFLSGLFILIFAHSF